MNILELVKRRSAVRKYSDRNLPEGVLDEIVDSGRWGPSVPSFLSIQPGFFVVITNKNIINSISEIILQKSKHSRAGVNFLLSSASKTISNAPTVILIYNSGEFNKFKDKYKEIYTNIKDIISNVELSAISAAIQNMILVADSLGVGSCWMNSPLFCQEDINKIINMDSELVAILTLGYPAENGKRAPRKNILETVKRIR